MVVFVPQFAQGNFKGARNSFWTHFAPFRAISHQIEKCHFAGSNIRNRSPDPQKGPKVVKNRGFERVLTGFERVLGLKGRYIVTFGQEAV